MLQVPKFSKYCHSVANLYSEQVPAIPAWMMADWLRGVGPTAAATAAAATAAATRGPRGQSGAGARVGPAPTTTTPSPVVVGAGGGGSGGGGEPVSPASSAFGAFHGASHSKGKGALSGKPVVLNMRVEPKTFFANERTFLQWVQTLATLMVLCTPVFSDSVIVGMSSHRP